MAVHKVLAMFESIDNITPTADKIGGSLGKLGGIAKGAGLAIAAGLAAGATATVAFVGSSIKMAGEFQDQLAIMGVATKSFGVDMGTLREVSLAVGGDVSLIGVSATGAADAITGLAKAGLTSTEVFGDLEGYLAGTVELGGALRASIDLAAASELDMVQASDLAAVALATFGGELETEEERAQFINAAMDNMVKAADASVASVSGLAAAMTSVGPTAASFGFSMQDTNNALAILSTRGIEGAEAGTALKSMMTNLMRPTDQVKDTLASLGVTIFDASGNMKELPTIIGDLSQAMYGMNEVTVTTSGRTAEQNALLGQAQSQYDRTTTAIGKHEAGLKVLSDKTLGKYQTEQEAANRIMSELGAIAGTTSTSMKQLTEEERLSAIQTLAGTYGMKAMSTLLGEGAEGWDAMMEATASAAGIQEQAAARTATLSGKMEGLSGVLETIQIEIGSAFLPLAEQVVDWAASMATQHGPKLIGIFERAAKGIQLVISAISGSIPFFVALIKSGAGAGEFLARMSETITPVTRSLTAMSGAGKEANDFLTNVPAAARPAIMEIGRMVGIFMSAVRIIKVIARGGNETAAAFSGIPASVQPTVLAISRFVKVVLENKDTIIAGFAAIGRAIASAMVAKKVAGIIKALTMLTSPLGIILAAVGILAFVWKSNFGDIQGKTKAAWSKLKPIFMQIADWLQTNIPKAIDAAVVALKPLWDWLSVNIPLAIQTLQNIFNTVWPAIQAVITTVVNAIYALWLEVFGIIVAWTQENMPLIQATIDTVFTAIQTVVSSALAFIEAFWTEHGAALMAVVSMVWGMVQNIITTAVQVVLGIIKTVMQIIQGDWEGAWTTMQSILVMVWELIKSNMATVVASLPAILEAGLTILQAAWSVAWDAIKLVAETVWGLITAGLNAMFTAWGEAFSAGGAAIQAIWNTVTDALKTKAGEAMDWIKAKFFTGVNAVVSIVSGITGKMGEVGAAIVEALKDGVAGAWDSFTSWLGEKLGDITDMLPFSMPKDPSSPLRKLEKGGAGIIGQIARGAKGEASMLNSTLSSILDNPLSQLAGLGGGGTMQLAGAGASSGGGGKTTNTTINYNLNYTGQGQGSTGGDSASQQMREIEVAAKLRR